MIHYLCLPISLWMISTAEVQLSVNHLPRTAPKVIEKSGVPVRNNRRQQPTETIDIMKEQLSNINSISSLLARNKVHHLQESIYHHINGIIPSLRMW